jgi:hypothetical protein
MLLSGHVRARAGVPLESKGTVGGGKDIALRCRLQEILFYNRRKGGVRIRMGLENPGGIDPALGRDCEFAIAGDEGLARKAVMMKNLIRCQASDARGRTCRAGAGEKDHLALAAFPLSAADTLKRYPGTLYGFKYGRTPWYRDSHICRTEEHADCIRHTQPRCGPA